MHLSTNSDRNMRRDSRIASGLPNYGRFLQADPIGYADNPNLYAYVGNDPINFVDPLGLCEDENVDAAKDGSGGDSGCPDGPDIIVTGRRPPMLLAFAEPRPPGGPADPKSENDENKPSVSDCLAFAGKKNGANLALDAGGAVLVLASAKFQVAAAVGGSVLGLIGIGTSIAKEDAAGAGLAFAGKQSANAGGIARAGSALARGALRFGAAAVAASTARDLAQAIEDYQKCRAGSGQ